jgi:hypothetical protein
MYGLKLKAYVYLNYYECVPYNRKFEYEINNKNRPRIVGI